MKFGSIDVAQVAYHRNGISGAGFFTILFTGPGRDDRPTRFVGTLVPEEDEETGKSLRPEYYSVLALGDLVNDHADRCWRGDHFAGDLWAATKAYQKDFCWPPKKGSRSKGK